MSDLLSRAIQIKNETTPKANTANRVGSLFQNIINELETITGNTIISLETEISQNTLNVENLNSEIISLETEINKNKIDINDLIFVGGISPLLYYYNENDEYGFNFINISNYITGVININEIFVRKNSIWFTTNYAQENSMIVHLKNCFYDKGNFVFESIYYELIGINNQHDLIFCEEDGFIYLCDRYPDYGATLKLVKINPFNLSDKQLIEFEELIGGVHQLLYYKGNLYFQLVDIWDYFSYKIIKVSTNFDLYEYEIFFTSPIRSTQQPRTYSELLFYRGNFISVEGTYSNFFRIDLIDLSGNLINTYNINYNGTSNGFPHWSCIFNDKLFVAISYSGYLIRINLKDFTIEEIINIPIYNVMDDNIITDSGYIYIFEENHPSDPLEPISIYKYYYKDFNISEKIESFNHTLYGTYNKNRDFKVAY